MIHKEKEDYKTKKTKNKKTTLKKMHSRKVLINIFETIETTKV
jgi:hypothetical protein